MTNGDDRRLEEQILDRFLDGIADDPEVSAEIVEVVSDLSDEGDFGGRDRLEERVLEVKDIDAD